ncbi:MAG TPA: FimV/HubP family polar landmark protein [Gammaproteobacteria bacterium]
MSPAARWGGLFLWLVTPGAWALGLGDIELDSALNQPLRAEILLVSATEDELATLRITLADEATFDRYGLDRPAFLANIDFDVTQDVQGRPVVAVTSSQAVAEPFVTLLIEANWSRGRILREYTVLLDPPVFLPAAVEPAVQPAQAGTSPAPQPAAPIDRPTPAALTPVQTPQAAPAQRPAAVQQTVAQPAQQAAAPTPTSYGPVQPAETLWSIANSYRPADVTTNQMMVSMFRANPQAFSGNMNTLHQGATLRIPQADEFPGVSAAEATQEVLRQEALWRGDSEAQARLRLVTPAEPAATAVATGGGGPSSGAAGGPAAADAATAGANQAATEVAELEGELQALRAELDDSQRLLEIRDQQLQELQEQLRVIEDLQQAAAEVSAAGTAPTADLEQEPLFADEAAPDEAETAAEPAVTVPPAVTQVVTPPSEPSLVSRILGWLLSPILLIGLGLLALVGTAAWYLRYRQQDVEDVTGRWEALDAGLDDDEGTREATERMRQQEAEDIEFLVEDEPALEEGETDLDVGAATAVDLDELGSSLQADEGAEEAPGETLTVGVPPAEPDHADTISSRTVINLEQANPIAEADFHMAYGLYDQAAELVEKALEAEPGRRDLTLKLLEVFFVWGNKDSFLQTAQALHAEIGGVSDSDWDKVVIMGKQICPDDALFTATPASAGSVDVDLEAGDSPELDMSFDSEDSAGVDLDLGDLGGGDIDFELEASGEQLQPAEDTLDVSDQTAAGLEAALLGPDAEPDDAIATDVVDHAAGDDAMDERAEDDVPALAAEDDAIEADLDNDNLADESTLADTIDQPGTGFGLTGETELLEQTVEQTEEMPVVERTGEMPTVEQPAAGGDARDPDDRTAEIDLDDLGLDIEDLADLTSDLNALASDDDVGSGATASVESDELSSSEISDVLADHTAEDLIGDDDATRVAAGSDDSSGLAIGDQYETSLVPGSADEEALLALGDSDATMLASDVGDSSVGPVLDDDEATMFAPGHGSDAGTGSTKRMEQPSAEELGLEEIPEDSAAEADEDVSAATASIELNLADLESALEESDTIEQPIAQSVGSDVTGSDSVTADAAASSRNSMLDPHTMTMTEVGTKLDLARAYMDMGDPDGAKSILEEVLEEGDENQRQEAQGLIESL